MTVERDHPNFPQVGSYKAFVACGVIEHCEDFRPFLDKAFRVEPRLILVSFFMSLHATQEGILPVESADHRPYYTNRYPSALVDAYCEDHGYRVRREQFPYATGTEDLLVAERHI